MTSISQLREITILRWRECLKNTLLGFLDVRLPSGLVVRGLTVHQKGDRKWVGLPGRPYQTDSGATEWTPVLEIPDRDTRERFEQQVLAAFDRHQGAQS